MDDFKQTEAAALLQWMQERLEDMLALIRSLVETESPSGDVEGSRAVAGLLVEEARTIEGVTSVELVESPGYGVHLRVRAFSDDRESSASSILLLGHTDTVHPRGSLRERPWRIEGNRVYGPGIFDMKANCALALEALRACATLKAWPRRSSSSSGEVVLLLTCDEETGSLTGRALVEEEARRAGSVLVLEPPATGGRVKTGRKGTGMYILEAHGVAAHAGLEPEKGASAILELARQIERLHAMNDPSCGITVTVGIVKGGTRSNVVPAEASAEIDVRFSTAEEARRIEAGILNLQPFDGRVRLTVQGGVNRPPLERTAQVCALFEEARRIAAALGFELGEAQVGGASDGNFAAALGAGVLDGLGIEGDGAHATHEHIVLDDIARRGALLAGLIASLQPTDS
jgi:glutamate carboxypeptidase